jgi:hypothetical protein
VEFQIMPANAPLTAAGSRDPDKQRPRPIPRKVREACDLMVYGRPDDEDCKPLDFIEAAKECGVAPDIMRRWLDRAQVRAYLLASRRTFREAICAGNEGALQRIRDKSPNGMAVIASVREFWRRTRSTPAVYPLIFLDLARNFWSFAMPDNPPLTAAGPRDPQKRPRPIRKPVREAIKLMVYGNPDDPDGKPLDFIEAGRLVDIKPDVMRRYLDRGDVRALLRSERRAFREAICAGNEASLRRVRDQSANGMVTVAAVRTLEQIDAPTASVNVNIAVAGYVIDLREDEPIDVTPTPPRVSLAR